MLDVFTLLWSTTSSAFTSVSFLVQPLTTENGASVLPLPSTVAKVPYETQNGAWNVYHGPDGRKARSIAHAWRVVNEQAQAPSAEEEEDFSMTPEELVELD